MAYQRRNKANGKFVTTHGKSKTTEFVIWCGIIQRCTDKNAVAYKDYGGRGIKVTKRWTGDNGFQHFLDDMGTRPTNRSLDRVDNNKGYSKKNCRWATTKEQAINKRTNRHFTINGIRKTLSQWIEETTVKSSTVRQRYYVYGWTIEQSLGFTSRRIES